MTQRNNDLPKYLTVAEAAKLLRWSENYVRMQIRAGKLPATKLGGQWRLDRDALLELLEPRGEEAESGDSD